MASRLCPYCMRMTEGKTCHHCGKHTDYSGQPMHLPAGYVINGAHPYVIGATLDWDGFGITYIALDMCTNQRVAIKEYFPTRWVYRSQSNSANGNVHIFVGHEDAYEKDKQLFLNNAQNMSKLTDLESIIRGLEFFEANNTAYVVMEYLDGITLKNYVTEHGRFSADILLERLQPLMEDIHQMHQRNILHRNIHPGNIVLLPNNQMKLIGFFSDYSWRGMDDDYIPDFFSNSFFPPEFFKISYREEYADSKLQSASADVYSLAAVIYYCITGHAPLKAINRLFGESVQTPSSLGAIITPRQEKALLKAFEIQKENRIQTIQEFLDQLSEEDAASSVLQQKNVIHKHEPKPTDDFRNKLLIKVLTAAAILVVSILTVVFYRNKTDSPELAAETSHAVSTAASEEPTETSTVPTEPQEPWEKNVLAFPSHPTTGSKPAFNGHIDRKQIASIIFLDSLEQAGPNSWDVSEAQDGSVMAWAEQNAIILDKEYDSFTNKTVYHELRGYTLYIAAEGGINANHCAQLFCGFANLKDIQFNGCFHTDYAESMQEMFYYCEELTNLDLSELQIGRVHSMKNMFFACSSLTQLDLSGLDTSNVTSMERMFMHCKKLKSLNMQNIDTSKVKNMSHMFSYTYALTELNITGFDTSSVTNMSSMFNRTDALNEVDISSFDTSSVTDMHSMFHGTNLKKLDLSHFDTSNVTDMSYMFFSSSLQQLNVTGFDTSDVRNMESMFHYCKSLHKIEGIEDWDVSFVKNHKNFMDNGKRIAGKSWEKFFQTES